ncbi:hypothetical protein D3C79_580870 [compost metagenome]
MAVHAGQRVVGQHRIGLAAWQLFQGLFCAMADSDLEAFALKVGLDVLGKDFIILDYQDALFHGPLPLQH